MKNFNVIIPAAGAATRLRPLTSNCSKAMIRIHGRPAIAYILDKLYKEGAYDVVVVDGKHDDIREYCSQYFPSVKFIRQEKMKGPRHAISLGFNLIEDKSKPLVVWLGDTLVFDEDLPLGTDFLLVKEVTDHSQWCMWNGIKFYNKPIEHVDNANALVGVYSFSDFARAYDSFIEVDGYEISDSLERYGLPFNSVKVKEWHDIGTLSSYQKTCAAMLTKKARAFNSFKYDNQLNVIEKVSKDFSSASQELKWYRNLTPEQRLFTPRLLDDGGNRLRLSYESGILLSDMFLYENITQSTAAYLIDKVFRIMTDYFWEEVTSDDEKWHMQSRKIWLQKTLSRLKDSGFSQRAIKYLTMTAEYQADNYNIVRCVHGDLHAGNIIYDPYNDSIKFIDPRGKFGDIDTNIGDRYYDIAKLSHDLFHGYGGIVANRQYPPYIDEIFIDTLEKYGYNDIDMINDSGLLLIATCIPCHYDDPARQKRMFDYVETYIENSCL